MFTTLALPYVVTSMRAPALAARHGRNVVTASALTLVIGHLVLIGTVALGGAGGSVLALLPGLGLVGIGMGLGIAPLTGDLLAGLRPEQAGAASGALTTAQYVGSALGVALVGIAYFGGLASGLRGSVRARPLGDCRARSRWWPCCHGGCHERGYAFSNGNRGRRLPRS